MEITAHGFWRHANDFLEAADAVKPLEKRKAKMDGASMVAYYLVGHSIELALKSFLVAKGYSKAELRSRKKYGHNLANLLKECRRRKLGREAKLENAEIEAINLLNATYMSKRFEYLEYGIYRLPKYFFIRDVAAKLVSNLSRYAMQSTLTIYD